MCSVQFFHMCPPFGFEWPQFVLLWILAGWLVNGLIIVFRQTPSRLSPTAVMLMCVLFWWLVALIELVALLALACRFVFDPDAGPVAMLVDLAKATSRHGESDYEIVDDRPKPQEPVRAP